MKNKQQNVPRSNAEVEYSAMAKTTTELIWLKEFLGEIGFLVPPMSLWCDSQSCNKLTLPQKDPAHWDRHPKSNDNRHPKSNDNRHPKSNDNTFFQLRRMEGRSTANKAPMGDPPYP